MITKKDCNAEANILFTGTGVNVTTDGRPYVGVAIGPREYVTTPTELKVKEWVSNVKAWQESLQLNLMQPFLLSPMV